MKSRALFMKLTEFTYEILTQKEDTVSSHRSQLLQEGPEKSIVLPHDAFHTKLENFSIVDDDHVALAS